MTLIKRLEVATGPDRELDAEIASFASQPFAQEVWNENRYNLSHYNWHSYFSRRGLLVHSLGHRQKP